MAPDDVLTRLRALRARAVSTREILADAGSHRKLGHNPSWVKASDLDDVLSAAPPAMNARIRLHLQNWNFTAAAELAVLSSMDDADLQIIFALGAVFGNGGFFDGQLGRIVDVVVENLLSKYSTGD